MWIRVWLAFLSLHCDVITLASANGSGPTIAGEAAKRPEGSDEAAQRTNSRDAKEGLAQALAALEDDSAKDLSSIKTSRATLHNFPSRKVPTQQHPIAAKGVSLPNLPKAAPWQPEASSLVLDNDRLDLAVPHPGLPGEYWDGVAKFWQGMAKLEQKRQYAAPPGSFAAEYATVASMAPANQVYVVIERIKHLPSPKSWFGRDKAWDPYVKFQLGNGPEQTTPVVSNNNDPEFKYGSWFAIDSLDHQGENVAPLPPDPKMKFELSVFDKDEISDDFIGSIGGDYGQGNVKPYVYIDLAYLVGTKSQRATYRKSVNQRTDRTVVEEPDGVYSVEIQGDNKVKYSFKLYKKGADGDSILSDGTFKKVTNIEVSFQFPNPSADIAQKAKAAIGRGLI